MSEPTNDTLRTRSSLIGRLGNWQDAESWELFVQTYRRLICGVARKAGLTETEAEDVMQETLFAVARQLPGFNYDRKIGSFKTWLLTSTRWHIADQLRRRSLVPFCAPPSAEAADVMVPLDNLADPNSLDLDALWEVEWQKSILDKAQANVKRRVDPRMYQIFDFYVNKAGSPEKVAATFSVPIGQVYLAKHRITQMLKAEVQRLEKSRF